MKIKFRAWDTERKEMAEVLRMGFDESDITLQDSECRTWETVRDYIAIPMQFTGMTDKNGAEIYEGDIVRIKGLPPFTFDFKREVVLKNGIFGCLSQNEMEHNPFPMASMDAYEVIGNIHENPELLEEQE